MNLNEEISLTVCRDFQGWEKEIKISLIFFLRDKLKLRLQDNFYFLKLNPESNAHKYAYLMRIDTRNKMSTYVDISIKDIERWIKK